MVHDVYLGAGGVLEFSSQINYVYNSKKWFLELTGIRNCNSITTSIACVQLEHKRVSRWPYEIREKRILRAGIGNCHSSIGGSVWPFHVVNWSMMRTLVLGEFYNFRARLTTYTTVYNSKNRFLELTGIRNCNTITAYVACVPLELKRVLPELGKPRKTIFESSKGWEIAYIGCIQHENECVSRWA